MTWAVAHLLPLYFYQEENMETLFVVLAFIGVFSAGFFCCLFLGCCVIIAGYNGKCKKKKPKERMDSNDGY